MLKDENENFYRLVSLLVDLGTEVLRQLFIKYAITPTCRSVSQFLVQETTTITRLQSKKVLRQDQVQLLCPGAGGIVDLNQWDISLLVVLLKNLVTINPSEKTEIENLRICRNSVYGHKSNTSLSHVDYNKYWNSIENSIKTIAAATNDQAFITRINSLIVKLKVGPLDIRSSVDILSRWYAHDTALTTRLDPLQTQLDHIGTELIGIQQRADVKAPDHVFENLRRHTRSLLEEKKKCPFVETTQYDNAKDMLEQNHVVIIAGKPGEGKTLTALQLMDSLSNDIDRCLVLFSPSQWDHVDVEHVDIIMLDDAFGKNNLDREVLRKWRPKLSTMQTYITSGKLKLIITSRGNILKEATKELANLELMASAIRLSSDELNDADKEQILTNLIKYHARDSSTLDITRCCRNYTTPIGFPYSCFLFTTNKDLFQLKHKFFKRPFLFFKETIAGLDKRSRAALLFLFHKQGTCHENEIKPSRSATNNSELKQFIAELESMQEGELSLAGIRHSLLQLTGIFTVHINKVFTFAHNTIYECIAIYHGKGYPEEVIENCTWDFLQGCIVAECDSDDSVMKIECDQYPYFTKRILKETVTKKQIHRFISFRDHSILDNVNYCESFFDVANKQSMIKEFLMFEMKGMGSRFLSLFCRANKETRTMHFPNAAMDHLQCQTPCHEENCWRCVVKTETLQGTCLGGTRDYFHTLLKHGAKITPRLTLDACKGGNVGLVEDVIATLKNEGTFDGTGVYSSKALFHAASSVEPMFDTLIAQGVVAMPLCIYDACVEGKLQTIQRFVEILKLENRWVPADILVMMAMGESISKKYLNIYEYLKMEGVKPNRGTLPDAVKTQDLSIVSKVVSDMKTCNTWVPTDSIRALANIGNITDKGVSEALILAMNLEDRSIYEFLKSENIQFDMKTLEWAVKKSSNKVFVEKIVEELKLSTIWKPDCTEAGNALLQAKFENKTEIFEFLLQEGTSVTVKHVSFGIIKEDIDIFKWCIKSLQKAGKWSPNDPTVITSFIEAYAFEDKAMFEHLKACGVQVNEMSIITAAIAGQFNAVVQFIEIMKTTGTWNPTDPFLNAYLHMSGKANRKIYDVLLNEGVGTTSKILLENAKANETRFAHRILYDLERTRQWNPKSDRNIIQAFEIYCSKLNGTMYNIMNKAGCVLTQRILHLVLYRSSSLYYGTGSYGKIVEGIPSLTALSAVKVAKFCIVNAAKIGDVKVFLVALHASEESSTSIKNSDEWQTALRVIFRNCNPTCYNIIADTDIVVTMDCIKELFTVIHDKLQMVNTVDATVLTNRDINDEPQSANTIMENTDENRVTANSKTNQKQLNMLKQIRRELTIKEQYEAIMKTKQKSLLTLSLTVVYRCMRSLDSPN